MSDHITLNAEPRSDSGKGASRRLRHQGKVPAIVYGGKFDPVQISIAHNEIIHELEHETIYTQVVNLKMDGKVQEVILRDLQRHPFKNKILHADFFRIDKNTPIKVVVTIHVLNAEDCVGVKMDGGMLTQMMTDVEIISLPDDLPEYLEIDALELHLGDMLHLTDIPMPKGVEIVALTHAEEGEDIAHSDHNAAVLAVVKQRAEEVIEDEAPEAPDSDEEGEDGEADDGDAAEGDARDDD
ncbi:MAG: 50S ribosomal protein L25/general stress protein Ctc [Gammaproteobacteria bacterium]|jgi:large subunit ribosomal protein L25|nr:50S ribosomal protein L25/general stress protein Ctc [Gammaproteobacteria bacterium]